MWQQAGAASIIASLITKQRLEHTDASCTILARPQILKSNDTHYSQTLNTQVQPQPSAEAPFQDQLLARVFKVVPNRYGRAIISFLFRLQRLRSAFCFH
jgi:hypothetical protein